jgi:hypothetical protein
MIKISERLNNLIQRSISDGVGGGKNGNLYAHEILRSRIIKTPLSYLWGILDSFTIYFLDFPRYSLDSIASTRFSKRANSARSTFCLRACYITPLSDGIFQISSETIFSKMRRIRYATVKFWKNWYSRNLENYAGMGVI